MPVLLANALLNADFIEIGRFRKSMNLLLEFIVNIARCKGAVLFGVVMTTLNMRFERVLCSPRKCCCNICFDDKSSGDLIIYGHVLCSPHTCCYIICLDYNPRLLFEFNSLCFGYFLNDSNKFRNAMVALITLM